ncbi:MAG: hypothetical protein O2864_05480 [Crenarchaeota archaeon]|nr:hypothetical protein [Thermoproteota archaeon]
MYSCLRCNKNKIDEENTPFCITCWDFIESNLLQVSPIHVLAVMKTEMTYKEIIEKVKMKKHSDVSGAIATSLRKLIRMRLVRLADKNTHTYAITKMGKTVLEKYE